MKKQTNKTAFNTGRTYGTILSPPGSQHKKNNKKT